MRIAPLSPNKRRQSGLSRLASRTNVVFTIGSGWVASPKNYSVVFPTWDGQVTDPPGMRMAESAKLTEESRYWMPG